MENNKINILGINISNLRKEEVLDKIKEYLIGDRQYLITTPNPEFVLGAKDDEEFFYIINEAELAIPDGVGLKFAGWVTGKNLKRITGADLIKDILKIVEEKNYKVAILNWNMGLSGREEITSALEKEYPNLKFLVSSLDREFTLFNKDEINNFNPDIIFCTLGAPWQEKFIFHSLKNIPSAKVGIGVGGAFDFLTGKIKRAPKIFRYIGFEWLWRLVKQPWRFRRIYNAVIKFPLAFIQWKFILPLLYRPNVVCILFKKESNIHKILLVERSDDKNHWQLPQGGTDGEKIEIAGKRELEEELSINKFKSIGWFKNLWKYSFEKRGDKYNYEIKKFLGYRGQKQSLYIAEYLGKDENIKINFWDHASWKWVDADNLVNEVHEVRQDAAKVFLNKFNKAIKNEVQS